MSRRARLSGDVSERRLVQARLLGRALFLFVLGLLFQTVWPGDILHYYGLYIALGTWLLFKSGAWLGLLVALLPAGFVVWLFTADYDAGWHWGSLTYVDFWTPTGFLRNMLFNGYHPIFPWLAFLLIGIWLGRLDLYRGTVRRQLMVVGSIVAVVAEAGSWFLLRHFGAGGPGFSAEEAVALFGRDGLPPNPLFVLQTGGLSVFVIGLCLEVGEGFREAAWLRPWLVLGQFALSIYLAHILIGLGVLAVMGQMDGQANLVTSTTAALVFCVVAMLGSLGWRRHFKHGPLEMAMRRLVDGRGTAPSARKLAMGAASVAAILGIILAVGPRPEESGPARFERLCRAWGEQTFTSEQDYQKWVKVQ